jgi:hypothetical protein
MVTLRNLSDSKFRLQKLYIQLKLNLDIHVLCLLSSFAYDGQEGGADGSQETVAVNLIPEES